MDFRKMEYFIKVAEIKNISKAAAQLHISHQALSKQLQQLEKEIGASLLERSSSGFILTEVGKKAYDIFYPIIQEYDNGCEHLKDFVKYKKETLRIGYYNALPYQTVIGPVVKYLNQQDGNLRIQLQAVDLSIEKQMLYEDQIDLAISVRTSRNEWKNVECIAVGRTPLRVIVSEAHSWFQKDFLTEDDIRHGELITYKKLGVWEDNEYFDRIEVKSNMQVDNFDTYMADLCQGEHFGIIGEIYSKREGVFKLLPLPERYAHENDVVCAFRKLHPRLKLLQSLEKIQL